VRWSHKNSDIFVDTFVGVPLMGTLCQQSCL
jgi:hypothetical protein